MPDSPDTVTKVLRAAEAERAQQQGGGDLHCNPAFEAALRRSQQVSRADILRTDFAAYPAKNLVYVSHTQPLKLHAALSTACMPSLACMLHARKGMYGAVLQHKRSGAAAYAVGTLGCQSSM